MASPELMCLLEMESRYRPAQILIVMHWPTRKVLNLFLPLVPGEGMDLGVRDYVYMGVI